MGRILVTVPFVKQGGVSNYAESVVPHLGKDTIVFKRGAKEGQTKAGSLLRIFSLPFRYLYYLIRYRPQRIIVNTSLSKNSMLRDGLLVALSKLFGKKVLLNVHGFRESALKYKRLLKWGYFKSDAICVLSSSFKKSLEEAGYGKQIYIQNNPVSDDLLDIDPKARNSLSNILFLSRIEEYKGIYIALEAFNKLKALYSDLHFDIVGDGSELENVKTAVEKAGIKGVEIHGFKSGAEKMELIARNDVLLFPTYAEGLPISVLEAMAAGLVVITRPVGGLVDLFDKCRFGALVGSKDPDDFAQAYLRLREDLQGSSKTSSNNVQFARANFGSRRIADSILEILEAL